MTGSFINNGLLLVNPASGVTLSIANAISGTGTLTKTGAGTLVLSGTNTYTGGTTVSGGTLSIASAGNLGTGTVTLDGGTLLTTSALTLTNGFTLGTGGGTIDTEGNSVTISGNLAGTGALTKAGAGTLVLSGTNTYTGGTTVSEGTLSITGSLSNSGTLTNSSGATLDNSGTLANSGALTSSGTLTNSGTITNTGGVLTIANGGTYNGYSGSSLSGGTVRVLSGGTLGLAVGSSLSASDLYFSSGGTYSILGSTTGTVTLNGTVHLLDDSNADTTGTLTKNSSSLMFDYLFSATAGASSATLSYTAKDLGSITGGNAGGLDAVRTGAATGSAAASYFNALYTATNLGQVQSAVQQTAGEGVVNSGQLVLGQGQAFHAAIGQQQGAFGGGAPHVLALGAAAGSWSTAAQTGLDDGLGNGLWTTLAQIMVMNSSDKGLAGMQSLGLKSQAQWLHQGARAGMSGYNAEMGLAALGYDMPLSDNARLGVAAGFSGGEMRGAGVTSDVKTWFMGPYGTVLVGPVTLDAALSYAFSQGTMKGSYSFPVADSTSGRFTANSISGNLKASHAFGFQDGGLRLIPSVGLEAMHSVRDAFTESGSSVTRRYAASTMTSLGLPIGAAVQRDFEFGSVTVTPEFSAFYVRQLADTAPSARVTLLDSATSSTTNTADPGRNLWRTGFGVKTDLGGGFAASASYTGEFGDRYSNNGAELQLKYAF